jgi:hypothetical protein
VPHHKTQQTAPPAGALPDEICIFKGDITELFYYLDVISGPVVVARNISVTN